MKSKFWLAIFCLLIVACSQVQPASAPTAPAHIPTTTPTIAPTLTPTITLSPAPTITPTPKFPLTMGTPFPDRKYSVIDAPHIRVINLQMLAKWGKGRATHVEFSPDGKLVLVASYSGLYLFDAGNLDLQAKLTDEAVLKAEFLSNGTKIASLQQSKVEIWDVATGQLVSRKILSDTQEEPEMSVSPFGDTVVVRDGDHQHLYILNSDLRVLDTLSPDIMTSQPEEWWGWLRYSFDVSDDGSVVLLSSINSKSPFFMYTVGSKGSLTPLEKSHYWSVSNMALSPDKSFVVIISGEGSYYEVISLTDDNTNISSISDLLLTDWAIMPDWYKNPIRFTADGKHIYFAYDFGADKARVMNLEDNSYKDFNRPAGAVLAVSPDGTKAVIASTNLDLIDIATGKTLSSNPNAFSPGLNTGSFATYPKMQTTNDMVILLSADNILRFISLSDGTLLNSYPADSFSYSATKNLLVIRKKGTISVLDPKTSEIKATTDIPGLGNGGTWSEDVAISPDGELIVAYNWKKQTVYILNSNDLSIEREIPYSAGDSVFGFSPDSQYIIASARWGNDGITMMRNTSTKFNRVISKNISVFIEFSHDGKNFVSIERDKKDRDRDNANWCEFSEGIPSCEKVLASDKLGYEAGAYSLSPDGKIFTKFEYGYGWKPYFRAWDTSSWSLLSEFELDQGGYLLSEFTPDGRFIVTAKNDGYIEVWGIKP